jgi:hypothetical protein
LTTSFGQRFTLAPELGKMKKEGFRVVQIAKFTNLGIKEIEKL